MGEVWGTERTSHGIRRSLRVGAGLGTKEGLRSAVRRGALVTAAALAAVAAGSLPGASAVGDATVTVRGVDLADLVRTKLNVVGCGSVFGRSGQPPRTAIGIAPDGPAGKRSLALTTAAGDAAGPIGYASSLAGTPAPAMSVHALEPMTGVGYVGYQAPADVGSNRMWVGRAELPVPAGQWTEVSLAGAAFSWIQYDMGTRQQLAGPSAPTPVAAFTGSQGGDGYGFYALGFGCEGREFNTDAWRIGAAGGTTTYDFDGYAASVTGGVPATTAPGEPVRVSAQVVSDGPAPRLVLEQRNAEGEWGAAPDQPAPGASSVAVRPTETTTYRWKIYSTPSVEAVKGRDETEPFTVTVTAPDPAPETGAPETEAPDRQPAKERAKQTAKAPAAPAPAADPAPAAPAATEAPAPVETATPEATPEPTPEPTAPSEPTLPTEPAETPAG
jgi:hypothetical protein